MEISMKSKYAVTFGEVMMRLSTPAFARFTQAKNFNVVFGGAEANVGISLAKFGIPATHVTRLPEHDLGNSVVQYLKGHGVDTSSVQFGTERLGVYFVENGAMHRAPKIIYDRSDSAFANITSGQFDWDTIMQQASWFHWTGITPAISQGAADECLAAIRAARKHGVRISGDINYRRNLWQYGKSATDVMPALIEGTDYMVAAVTDITNCLGIAAEDFDSASARVMKQCPSIKRIACTQRNTISASHNKLQGSLWNGKQRLSSREYDLTHIVDRIGGGDAYMAGLIYGWMKNFDDQQTLEFATAASVLKHSIEGDANVVTVEEVQSLVKNENTGKLLR
jgi:2-dehydro-3-deoxygluconokinase